MSIHHFFGAAVIAFLGFFMVACSPDTSPSEENAEPAPAEPAQAEVSDPPSGAATADTGPTGAAPAEKPDASAEPKALPQKYFDLQRKDDRLLLSGRIRSELQARDIATALDIDGLTLENDLEVDSKTPGVDWGNRVDELLPQLVATIENLHFHVEDGVITVKGEVKSEQEKNQLQRDIVYVMESPLITDLKNELKIEEAGSN